MLALGEQSVRRPFRVASFALIALPLAAAGMAVLLGQTRLGGLLGASAVLLGLGVWAVVRGGGSPDSRGPCEPPGERGMLDRLEARRRIERHNSEQLDLEQILVIAADSALRLIGGGLSVIYLREGDVLRPRAWTSGGDWVRDLRIPVGAGVMGAVAAGEGLIVNDYQSSPLALPEFRGGTARLVVQPLHAGGRMLGAMVISRDAGGAAFSEDDLSALADFATQAAVAIENARLFAEAGRSAAEYQALFEVAALVGSTLDFERVLDLIVDRSRALMEVASVGIFKLDAEAETLVYERGVGLSEAFMGTVRVRVGEGTTGMAVRDRKPVWTTDIRADQGISLASDTRHLVTREGYRAVLSVPIATENELHGALSAYWWEPHEPSESEIRLMTALASQAAIALQNARLYGAATARGMRLAALGRLTGTLTATLRLEEVLSRVVRSAVELFGPSVAQLWLADGDDQSLSLRAEAGAVTGVAGISGLALGQGLPGRVAATRLPLVVPDLRADPRVVDVGRIQAEGMVSFAGVPLIIGDRVLGALGVALRKTHRFSDEDLSLLRSLGNHAAIAIENARLYAETSGHLAQTRALLEVTEILNSTLDSTRLLKLVAIKIAQVCRVDRCSIERWDGGRVIPLMSQFADGRKDERMWSAFMTLPNYPPRDVPAHAQAIETRCPVIVRDAAASDRIPREWTEAFGHKSYMAVPLIRQDTVIGVMSLDYVERVTPFERWQVDLAVAIGSQLALTIENTRLYSEAQERLGETATLLAVAQVLSQPAPAGDVMRRLAREVARAFGADMVGVYLLDERKEALVPVAGYHVPKHLLNVFTTRPFVLARFPALRTLWTSGQAFWSTDVKNDPRIDPDTFAGVDPHAVLFAPTRVRGESVGSLFLVWWGTGREFQPAEIRLIEGVAAQVGLAMENAELVRQTQLKLEETARLYEERARAHAELAATQDQLVRTEKLRALGEMASGVAHGFNNVLASVLGRAQLLLTRLEDPTLRQWVEVIERAALDGARTVRRLQDFTRIRRDHPAEPVDLNQVVRETLEATESAWRQESRSRGVHIEVTTRLAAALPRISGDPAELREGLTNLILNALDAMPGGGTLTLATVDAGDRVEITITDTGVGIPASIRHKIFDPFFTTKGPKGTGLGLSMTYGILARHGGRIAVESEERRGSTFRLTFPVASLPPEPPAPLGPLPVAAASLRVLVVDDEERVAAVLGDMLTSLGHRVEVASTGREAIERFDAEGFDLVLTDLAMPEMTGWEVARAIKDRAPAVRIVLVSGFGVEVSPADLRAHGVDLVLPKPLGLQDIETALSVARSGWNA
jgi:GAF domain-containing protein